MQPLFETVQHVKCIFPSRQGSSSPYVALKHRQTRTNVRPRRAHMCFGHHLGALALQTILDSQISGKITPFPSSEVLRTAKGHAAPGLKREGTPSQGNKEVKPPAPIPKSDQPEFLNLESFMGRLCRSIPCSPSSSMSAKRRFS